MSLDNSIVAVDILLLKDRGAHDISEGIMKAALTHLDSYIEHTFVKAMGWCTSYFSLTSDDPSSVVRNACASMSIANVESKIIEFDKTAELMQVKIKTTFKVEHEHSTSAATLADAFILHQAQKITEQSNFPLGIRVKCLTCTPVRLHWYTFSIVRNSKTDANNDEAVAPFEHVTTSHLNSFVGDPKIPLASTNVVATGQFRNEALHTANGASRCQDRGFDFAATEYHLPTLIVSTFPADLNETVANGLKHALHSNILTKRLEPSFEASEFGLFQDMCTVYAFVTEMKPDRSETRPPTPAPSQPVLVSRTSTSYEQMDIAYWTKVLIVIPFLMLCVFGAIMFILHRRRSKHDFHQVHPIKVEV